MSVRTFLAPRPAALAGALALALTAAVPGTALAAAYATGGTGQYREQILWLTWGGGTNGTHNIALGNGSSTTASVEVTPGRTLAVTCALADAGAIGSSGLQSYRPGGWSGDALDDLYNIGGTGNANQLITGIYTTSSTRNFRVNCTATLGGEPFRMPGLVMADAESMNNGGTDAAPTEFLLATAIGTWNVVEMNREAGRNYFARKTTSGATQSIRFGPGGESGSSRSPAAITFLSFADGAYAPGNLQVGMDFSIKGGGNTAIAIGLLAPYAEFGDAPASYGVASHMIPSLDVVPDGLPANGTSVNINTAGFQLGMLDASQTLYIGSRGPDSELASPHSVDAKGDDNEGVAGANEEDAWPAGTVIYQHQIGEALRQPIACIGAGTLAGWIDFDRNGTFDPAERAQAACSGGIAELVWTIPNALEVGRTYARLRFASLAAEVADPIGTARDGEVEDHVVDVRIRADVSVTKTVAPTEVVRGGEVTYTMVVGNAGESAGDGTVLRDPAVPGLDCAAATLQCAAAGGAQCPAAPTVAALQSADGIAVPVLPVGGTATFTMTCIATGTGTP